MLWLVVGAAILFALMGGLRAFERASVTSIKALFTWIAALGGLSLALLLVLTGRGGIAVGALTLFGPLVYQQWQAARGRKAGNGNDNGGTGPRARPSTGPMSRQEAFDVLGLQPGATEPAIRDAYRRLMRGAHPDVGGSDWLAARINQARDVLLR